jgi:hypothetical protein
MKKLSVILFISGLLAVCAYLYGMVSLQASKAYLLLLNPNNAAISQVIEFLIVLCLLTAFTGLAAILLRPVWFGLAIFFGSAIAMFAGWQFKSISLIFCAIYFLGTTYFYADVVKELKLRVKFSLRPMGERLGILKAVLIAVFCGSFYFGYARHIETKGFVIPDIYINVLVKQIEKPLMAQIPEDMQPKFAKQLHEETRRSIDDLYKTKIKGHEKLVPLIISVSFFMILGFVSALIIWVPIVLVKIILVLFTSLGLTKIDKETQEIEQLKIS